MDNAFGNHPAHETLNEYLDGMLEPPRRAETEAHLSRCPECTARLVALRGLFTALETLPDEPLGHDLVLSVLAGIRSRTRPKLAAQPALRLVFAAQALIALILLGLAVPVAAHAPGVAVAAELGGRAERAITETLAAYAAPWLNMENSAYSVWTETVKLLRGIAIPPLPWLSLGACLSAVTALWLVGNGLLLRPNRYQSYETLE